VFTPVVGDGDDGVPLPSLLHVEALTRPRQARDLHPRQHRYLGHHGARRRHHDDLAIRRPKHHLGWYRKKEYNIGKGTLVQLTKNLLFKDVFVY